MTYKEKTTLLNMVVTESVRAGAPLPVDEDGEPIIITGNKNHLRGVLRMQTCVTTPSGQELKRDTNETTKDPAEMHKWLDHLLAGTMPKFKPKPKPKPAPKPEPESEPEA